MKAADGRACVSIDINHKGRARRCKERNAQKSPYFDVFWDPPLPGGLFYGLSANPLAPVHSNSPLAKDAAARFFNMRKRTRAPAEGCSPMRAAA